MLYEVITLLEVRVGDLPVELADEVVAGDHGAHAERPQKRRVV